MKANTYNTEQTAFQIFRDGQVAKDYKPKVIKKRIKLAITLIGLITAAVAVKLTQYAADKLEEISRPVRLDIIDHTYGTSLRSQYFSGLRTQQILAAKRQHGLM